MAGRRHRSRCEVVVARDGPLVADFGRHAEVVVAGHHDEPAEPAAAALRRAGHPELARVTGDRWLRHRLRHVGVHDLVYVNSISSTTARLLAALPRSPPGTGDPVVVTHVHELDMALRHNIAPEELAGVLDRSDHLIAVSEAVAHNLVDHHGADPDHVHVHHGFIDTRPCRAPPPATPSAPASASPTMPSCWVRSAFRTGARPPTCSCGSGGRCGGCGRSWTFTWCGSGGSAGPADRWQLSHEAAQLGLDDRTHLVAEQPSVAGHLAAFDAFALTAREDAFPLAVIEAAAAGVPGGRVRLRRRRRTARAAMPAAWCRTRTPTACPALAGWADDPAEAARVAEAGTARVRTRHDTSVAAPRLWGDLLSWLPG